MRSEAGREMVKHWTRVGQVKIVVKGESTEQLIELAKASNNAVELYFYQIFCVRKMTNE